MDEYEKPMAIDSAISETGGIGGASTMGVIVAGLLLVAVYSVALGAITVVAGGVFTPVIVPSADE